MSVLERFGIQGHRPKPLEPNGQEDASPAGELNPDAMSRRQFLQTAGAGVTVLGLKPTRSVDVFLHPDQYTPVLEATPNAITSYNLEIPQKDSPESDEWTKNIAAALGITIEIAGGITAGSFMAACTMAMKNNPGASNDIIRRETFRILTKPSRRESFGLVIGSLGGISVAACSPFINFLTPKTSADSSTAVPPTSAPKSPSVPPATTMRPPSVEVAPTPNMTTRSIREAVTAFREASKIPASSYNTEQDVVVISPDTRLRVVRKSDDEFEFGPKGSAMTAKFTPDRVEVLLPFDSLTDKANGMGRIVDTTGNSGTNLMNFIVQKARERGLMSGGESVQYPAAGSSGTALRGHAILVNVLPQGNDWIITSPWLTNKNTVSNWVVINNQVFVNYKFADGKEVNVPLENLMAKGKTIEVSVDGAYKIDGRAYGKMLRDRGIDNRVVTAYEEIFIPPTLKGEWSSRKEGNDVYHDASKAFQYVGSRNDEHAHMLDLTMGTLNLGVMTKKEEDLIALPLTLNADGTVTRSPKALLTLKEKYGSMIMNNQGEMAGVQDRLMAVKREISGRWGDEVDKNAFRNFIVIVEGAAIAQVIRKTGKRDSNGDEILERFKVGDGGKLVDFKDFELYSKSPLEVRDGKIMKDGKIAELRGVLASHFLFQLSTDNPDRNLNNFKRDMDSLLRLGGKFVSMQLNFGSDYLNNPRYRETVAKAAEYAKSRGLIVELAPRGLGRKSNSNFDGELFENWDEEVWFQAWNNLLSDPIYAQRLGACVDMFAPNPEAGLDKDGIRVLEWREIKPKIERINKLIRQRIRSDVICTYSPPFWASDITPVLGDPLGGDFNILEWHPYRNPMTQKKRDFDTDLQTLIAGKIPFIVGEFGGGINSPKYLQAYVLNQFQKFVERHIGFAYHPFNGENSDELSLIVKGDRTTMMGYIATIFHRANLI